MFNEPHYSTGRATDANILRQEQALFSGVQHSMAHLALLPLTFVSSAVPPLTPGYALRQYQNPQPLPLVSQSQFAWAPQGTRRSRSARACRHPRGSCPPSCRCGPSRSRSTGSPWPCLRSMRSRSGAPVLASGSDDCSAPKHAPVMTATIRVAVKLDQ